MCNCSSYVIQNIWRNESLGSYLIKCSRLYSTFFKAMKKISTKERVFISLVRPSGSGKWDIEFQNTHIVLFKSPRYVSQINTFKSTFKSTLHKKICSICWIHSAGGGGCRTHVFLEAIDYRVYILSINIGNKFLSILRDKL